MSYWVEHGCMGATEDERNWVLRSQNGDPEAFAALVKKYQRMVDTLAYRMTGSQADAEDLAQETFIQAFRQLPDFRAEARFSSWLYRIAVNRCLNWKRRSQRQEQLHEDWRRRPETTVTTDESVAQQVQEALLKLNPKQRAAVVLTVYDGLNHAEAAQVLGCSETTISWRLFAARSKLKRLLNALSD